jgi:hypothetical protein
LLEGTHRLPSFRAAVELVFVLRDGDLAHQPLALVLLLVVGSFEVVEGGVGVLDFAAGDPRVGARRRLPPPAAVLRAPGRPVAVLVLAKPGRQEVPAAAMVPVLVLSCDR